MCTDTVHTGRKMTEKQNNLFKFVIYFDCISSHFTMPPAIPSTEISNQLKVEYTTLLHFISRFTHFCVPICLIIYSKVYASVSMKTCWTQHRCQGKSFKPECLFLADQRAHNRKTKSPWFAKGMDEECATIWCADLGNAFEDDQNAIVFHLPIGKTTQSLKNLWSVLLCFWSETENGIVIINHVSSNTPQHGPTMKGLLCLCQQD